MAHSDRRKVNCRKTRIDEHLRRLKLRLGPTAFSPRRAVRFAGDLKNCKPFTTSMKILLINHYAGSPRHGMEFRPYYLAHEWVRAGHQVTIVAASHSHLRSNQP